MKQLWNIARLGVIILSIVIFTPIVIPMNKFGEPKHVADAIAFLASDEAEYITGQVLTVCGGMVTC